MAYVSLKKCELLVLRGVRKQSAAQMHDAAKSRITQQPRGPQRFLPDAACDDVPFRGIQFVQTLKQLRCWNMQGFVEHAEHRFVRLAHVQHDGLTQDTVEMRGIDFLEVYQVLFLRLQRNVANRRFLSAKRTRRIAFNDKFANVHAERIHEQQPADERFTDAENQFERFIRLERADDARKYTKNTAFRARRHRARRRRLREKTPITRAALRCEDADLSVKTKDRTINVGFAFQHARIVDEVARFEAIGAVDDDVVQAHEIASVRCIEARGDRIGGNERIDLAHALRGNLRFGLADVTRGEDRLTLQIAFIHRVVVHDADSSDARGGKILEHRRAEAACADAEHTRSGQSLLSCDADFRNQQMPAISA